MSDAQIAVIIVAVYAGAFALAGLWFWTLTLGLVAAAVGIGEAIAVKFSKGGLTISKQFWKLRQEKPKVAYALIALLAAGWVGLLVHLLWK